jgi:hypothetical protein
MAAADVVDVATLQKEIERLLSKENIAEDKLISTAINPQLYVPIATVVKALSAKAIAGDENSVRTAVEKSAELSLDETKMMVKPLLKSKRDTIILRDIPDDVTEADIRELVGAGPKGDAITTVTAEVNQTWFVKMETEEACQDIAWWLRSQKFRGAQVKVAIKSEHYLRSFFQAPAGSALPPDTMKGGMDMKGKGGMPAMFPAAAMMQHGMFPPWMAKGAGKSMGPIDMGPSMPVVANQANLPVNIFDNVGRGRGKGGFGGKEKGAEKGPDQKGKGKGKGKKGKRPAGSQFDTDADLIRAMEDMNLQQATEPYAGYEHEYRAYSKDELKKICASMQVVDMPDPFKLAEHAVVVKTTAETNGWVPSPEEEAENGKEEVKMKWEPKQK